MKVQVTLEDFKKALQELGHDPATYAGQRLSLKGMAELYELEEDAILDAIVAKKIGAHYDYMADTVWVDALDAAHFYFTIRNLESISFRPKINHTNN